MASLSSGRSKSFYHLTGNGLQSWEHPCTSVSEMPVDHEAQRFSVLVVRQELLWDMKHIRNILHILETKSLPVTTLFSTGYMQMAPTNNMETYTVWVGNKSGDFVKADGVLVMGNTVSFFLNGKEVKQYDKEEFLKYNPKWKWLENTE